MSDKKIDTTSTVDGVNSVQYEADYSIGVVEPISQHEGQLRRTFKARHIQMMTLSGYLYRDNELSSKNLDKFGVDLHIDRWLCWKWTLRFHRQGAA